MNQPFRIIKKENFRVIGQKLSTTNRKKEGARVIPQYWSQFKEKGIKDKLLALMNQAPFGLFGINVYNTDPDDPRKFNYYIAVSGTSPETSDFTSYIVQEALWAVFPCTIETMGQTQVQAIVKWLPGSGYKPLNTGYITGKMKSEAPDIEYYGENGTVEIWIAVRKK